MYPYKLTTPYLQAHSLIAVQIELLCGSVCVGWGTAFMDEIEGKGFLITNWHNVTGRNPYNGRQIKLPGHTPDGCFPDSINIYVHGKLEGGGVNYLCPVKVSIPIEYRTETNWFMHERGQDIDIVVLQLSDDVTGLVMACLSKLTTNFNAVIEVGSDVFIIGFPRGLRPTGSLPIWKSGTIATEPVSFTDGEPCFWVDSATREGMSGSPVFVRDAAFAFEKMGARAFEPGQEAVITPSRLTFAGVYSGRVGTTDMLEAQLGKVWRPEVIGEVLQHRRPLDYIER